MKIRNILIWTVIASSVLWGALYPEILRYPAYLWLAGLFILLNFRLNKNITFIISGVVISIYSSFAAQSLSSFLYCLIIILFIYFFSSSLGALKSIKDEHEFLKCISVATTLNSIILVIQYAFESSNFISGLFPEPSNLGYTFGPLLALLLVNKITRSTAVINLSISALLSPSSTLLISFVATLGIWAIRNTKKSRIFLAVICMILIGSAVLYISDIYDSAISDAKNASLQIWLYGYLRAIDVVTNISFIGVGPFGWIPESGEEDASSLAIELMNQRDLASMIPFGMASFGVIFPVLFLYIIYLVTRFDRANSIDTLFSIIVLGFIVTACFRWAGLTLSPLLIFGSILIAIRSGATKSATNLLPRERINDVRFQKL